MKSTHVTIADGKPSKATVSWYNRMVQKGRYFESYFLEEQLRTGEVSNPLDVKVVVRYVVENDYWIVVLPVEVFVEQVE